MMKYYYIIIAVLTIAVAVLAVIGYIYLSTSGQRTETCAEGFLFSQAECACIEDVGCRGLDKDACDQNPDCTYFTRSGTCYCPSCEILTGQCLPR